MLNSYETVSKNKYQITLLIVHVPFIKVSMFILCTFYYFSLRKIIYHTEKNQVKYFKVIQATKISLQ